ncbi:(E3-independent) E2 ubiquitin-conjugating enzyme UBE2O-like [Acyrthosiphon pisum]|uniref:UBC core domain-containing protein n=1 Tax=Acyrthosiphon pisum TaxID=7029 RepID=A0A8R2NWX1_ACYPI|nr:(E3-independent) E2 ubiquitin-conjugating enzyme UBE2O-like [Acyrthosiphon pisum]|eukprot:XP_008185032.1 PREDICTED: (E3-independent) E2 ubiquitin-conjugating enzyme UBE2O-like [Acyrthosiphon pisum]
MDRSLMPGDVVRKVSEGKPSQFGYCENIDKYATVKILNTNKIIENINSRNLTRTDPFLDNSLVFYESWVGGVYKVKRKVTFVSQDGSIFTLEDPHRGDIKSLCTSDVFSIGENAFYHGQKFKIRLNSLKKAKFLTISNLMKCLWHNYKKNFSYKFGPKWVKVYVQDVIVSSVEVKWYYQFGTSETQPPEEYERLFTGDDLKKLKTFDIFKLLSTKVGNKHWYTIKDNNNLMTMKQWRSKCTEAFNIGSGPIHIKTNKDKQNNKLGTNKRSKISHPIELDAINKDDLLLSTQNGSGRNASAVQRQINERILNKKYEFANCESKPSTSRTGNCCVYTFKSIRLKRNRMRKLFIKKSKQFNKPKIKTKPNSKVVVEVCYTKSVVDVIWQDGTKETGVSSTDLYPVNILDHQELFPGNFVIEKSSASDVYGVVESVDRAERTAHIQWFKVCPENPSLPNPIEKTYFSLYDLHDHPYFHFKSGFIVLHTDDDTYPDLNSLTFGHVLSTGPDGKISVISVDGEKTKYWPEELYPVEINDNGLSSFQNVEYDLSGYISTTSPGSSNDQVYNEWNYTSLFVQLLQQSATSMKLFLDAVQQNCDMDKVLKLNNALEQYRSGFNISSFMPTSEFKGKEKEIETWYKDLMDNISKLINKIISRIEREEGELVEEQELSFEILIKDSVTKLKQLVYDFIKKVHLVFNELYGSKYGIIRYSDTKDESDDFSPEKMDVTEPESVLPVIEPHPAECRLITLDTEPVDEVTKQEYKESITKPEEAGVFDMVETLMDNSHMYINFKDDLNPSLLKVIAKDIQILQQSLPAGIWVKTFENRMDLFSIMIRGPEKTPYAGGLFLFDVKIPPTYPIQPPLCHYYSYCADRLNPNLYEDGKVCLSLLGTWAGHGVELWSPNDSNLLQLLVSIQGLILVSEPYYNEPGFDNQRGQKLAKENSRVYNEMALIKVAQSMTNMLKMNNSDYKTAGYFKEEILEHVKTHGPKLISTIENWIKMSEKELTEDEKLVPGYPLLPLSKGFCLSIIKALKDYKEVLISMNIIIK